MRSDFVKFELPNGGARRLLGGTTIFRLGNDAGLLKGSVSAAERPRTLRQLRSVYSPGPGPLEPGTGGMGTGHQIGPYDDGLDHQPRCRQPYGPPSVPPRREELNNGSADKKNYGQGVIMTPFDEQEEWAKISEIMASFGTGLVRESVFVSELEKEFQTRLGLTSDTGSPCVTTLVGQWLSKLRLNEYETLFLNYGFDDIDFINGVLDEVDLKDMGINDEQERAAILEAATLLNNGVEKTLASNPSSQKVDDWLNTIKLEQYSETFRKHLYLDMERVRRVWEVELAAVLEIQKPAHRKRILASVNGCGPRTLNSMRNGSGPNIDDLNKDLNILKTNIQQLKEEIREKLPEATQGNGLPTPTSQPAAVVSTPTRTATPSSGTLKHRKNRPAPQPPQRPPNSNSSNTNNSNSNSAGGNLQNGGDAGKTNGTPASNNSASQAPEKLEIRAPSELLFGVPSTLKTQWRHQPKDLVTGCVTYVANYLGSTVVKELRGTESTKKSIQKLKISHRDPRGSPDITLSISYRGVRFLNTVTDEPICDHEIRNIHCACQDADDLTHFAYITKDHVSKTHFCHVFCVPTMDQATEIILTLGQAFEVAYQIALKDKLTSRSGLPPLSSNSCVNSPSHQQANSVLNHSNSDSLQKKQHSRSRSHPNPLPSSVNSNNSTNQLTPTGLAPKSVNTEPSRDPSPRNHSNSNVNNNNNNIVPIAEHCNKPVGKPASRVTPSKFLAGHGRSYSQSEIKINGSNQLKLAPAPVDDINIGGVRDMKAGSRAPIALTEEL